MKTEMIRDLNKPVYYEQARKLQDLGYNWYYEYIYAQDENTGHWGLQAIDDKTVNYPKNYIPAPMFRDVFNWLRDQHKIETNLGTRTVYTFDVRHNDDSTGYAGYNGNADTMRTCADKALAKAMRILSDKKQQMS